MNEPNFLKPLLSWHPFLVALLPFIGFMLTGLFGRRLGKRFTAVVACAAPLLAFCIVLSAFLVRLLTDEDFSSLVTQLGAWIPVGTGANSIRIDFTFRLDHLSILMGLIVTGVGSLIHIYSTGYMAEEDPIRFARYFSYLNLFMGMMLVLILGDNLLLMFIGWEGVGLCSYLLIGFEYEVEWKARAGMKAFVANRIGDFAFILGLIMIVLLQWQLQGTADLTFRNVNALAAPGSALGPDQLKLIGLAALCLFIGATGKSAQIPLFVWLPDAMAGPTPVSALIHAATMVTAGVYMCVRLGTFFIIAQVDVGSVSLDVLNLIAIIGAMTAFVAATAAMVQTDIKKVLAYSTVSQLGFMFMAVGTMAYGAAVFHLMTHAFFKALLFLGAGAVIHALHGEQDMLKMGGLWKELPVPFWSFLIGGAALAGVPLFSGFFSKDMIIWSVYERVFETGGALSWRFIWILAMATAVMTAFYTTRLILLTFFGKTRLSDEAVEHIHPPGPSMAWPLTVLIVLSFVGGWVGLPKVVSANGDRIGQYLKRSIAAPHSAKERWLKTEMVRLESAEPAKLRSPTLVLDLDKDFEHAHHAAEVRSIIYSILAVLIGAFLSWRFYRNGVRPEPAPDSGAVLVEEFLREAWGFDQFYQTCIVEPCVRISRALHRYIDDGVIDGWFVNGGGRISIWVSEFVTAWQTGLVSRAAFYMAIGALALLIAALYAGAPQ